VNHPPCIIQSRGNGKFYPVNVEDGEVDLENGGYIAKKELEIYYEIIDRNDRFCNLSSFLAFLPHLLQ